MNTGVVFLLLGVVSIIPWTGATPIADKEWKETSDNLNRDKRDVYDANIEPTMNPYGSYNAPFQSNYESYERSNQRQSIVGADVTQNNNRFNPSNGMMRGAVINQNRNDYNGDSNGGTIQGAVINQTGNSYGTNSYNSQDHEQKSVATNSNQQLAEKLTNEDYNKNSKWSNYEELKPWISEDFSTTDTLQTDVNGANFAQPETQLPPYTSVSNFYGLNEDYYHSNNNNYQSPGVMQSPTFQGMVYFPPQYGSQRPQLENLIPNSNNNIYGQGFEQFQAPQAFPGAGFNTAQLFYPNQQSTMQSGFGDQQFSTQSGIGNQQSNIQQGGPNQMPLWSYGYSSGSFVAPNGFGNQQSTIQQGFGNQQMTQQNGFGNQQITQQNGFGNQQSSIQQGFGNLQSTLPQGYFI